MHSKQRTITCAGWVVCLACVAWIGSRAKAQDLLPPPPPPMTTVSKTEIATPPPVPGVPTSTTTTVIKTSPIAHETVDTKEAHPLHAPTETHGHDSHSSGGHIPGDFGHVEPLGHGAHGGHGGHEIHGVHGHGLHCEGCEIHNEDEGSGLFFNAELLIFRARRRAADFAIQDPVNPVVDGSVDGNVLSLNFDTRAGWRFGAGYRLGHGWESALTYTYLHTKDNQAAFPTAGGALLATPTAPGGINQVNAAIASMNLDMDVFDLDLAKRITITDDLLVKLSGGLRYADISQKFSAFYQGQTAGVGVASLSSPVDFHGIGIRMGSEAAYRLNCTGLELFVRGHLSLLSGDFTTQVLQTANNNAAIRLNVRDKYEAMVPVIELALGVTYRFNEHMHMSMGYELANWFNMIESVNFVDSFTFGKIGRRLSDLSLEALTFKMGIRY